MSINLKEDYFSNYDDGKKYEDCFMQFSDFYKCLAAMKRNGLHDVFVLGCATGHILKSFIEEGVDAHGIELSDWAVNNCLPEMKDRILHIDMVEWFKMNPEHKAKTCFSNSICYLTMSELDFVLTRMSESFEYAWLSFPSIEDEVEDKYRVINQSREWWSDKIGQYFEKYDHYLYKCKNYK